MRVMTILKELRHGGAETVAVRIMDAGPESDQAIVAVPGEWSDRFPGTHYDMGPTSLKPQDIVSAARSIRAAIKDFRPDIVHAHSPGTIVAASVALGVRRPVPLLGTCHGGGDAAGIRRQAMVSRALRVPMVACGPGVEVSLRNGGLEPIATINNGIPLSTLEDTPLRDLATEFNLDPNKRTAVVVGRLDPVKNQAQIIEAMALEPNMNLLVCGDGTCRIQLEERADALGLSDRVRFLGSRRDVSELVRAAGIQILSSRLEGLPVALLEGMAEGAAIVATDVLGTRQLIDDGVNGLLVPLDDAQALADALHRLDLDDDLRRSLARGGLATVEDYTLDQMTESYWDLYRRMTANFDR